MLTTIENIAIVKIIKEKYYAHEQLLIFKQLQH